MLNVGDRRISGGFWIQDVMRVKGRCRDEEEDE